MKGNKPIKMKARSVTASTLLASLSGYVASKLAWSPFHHKSHSHRVRSGFERFVRDGNRSKYKCHQGVKECARRVERGDHLRNYPH